MYNVMYICCVITVQYFLLKFNNSNVPLASGLSASALLTYKAVDDFEKCAVITFAVDGVPISMPVKALVDIFDGPGSLLCCWLFM